MSTATRTTIRSTTTTTTARPVAAFLGRLAQRRTDIHRRREFQDALAGDHGPGVQAEVRAALAR